MLNGDVKGCARRSVMCGSQEDSEEDVVQLTLSGNFGRFLGYCLDLLEGSIQQNKICDEVSIIRRMVQRIDYEVQNGFCDSEMLECVFNTEQFRQIVECLVTVDDRDVAVECCRLILRVCRNNFWKVDDDIRQKLLFEYLVRCDRLHVQEKAKRVALVLCNRETDCSCLVPLICMDRSLNGITDIAKFLKLQLHFLAMTCEMQELFGTIWASGNELAKRDLMRGVMWCAKHDVKPVIEVFTSVQWVDAFAEYLSSKLYVNVLTGFRLFQALSPYLDPATYPDQALLWAEHEWITSLGQSQVSDRYSRVCIAITDCLRQRIEICPEFARTLIDNDGDMVNALLSQQSVASYTLRAHILMFIVSIILNVTNADILAIDSEKLCEEMLSMLGYIPPDVISKTLMALRKVWQAHMCTASSTDIPTLFAAFNGPDMLAPIITSGNEENVVLARELLAELVCDQ